MITAVRSCLSKYAQFGGRATRAEYWWFFLFYVLSYVVAFFLDTVLNTSLVITVLVILALVLPLLSVSIRRLHDTGHSGWWYLIAFVPIIGGLWLLFLLLQPSSSSMNEYGPEPNASAT